MLPVSPSLLAIELRVCRLKCCLTLCLLTCLQLTLCPMLVVGQERASQVDSKNAGTLPCLLKVEERWSLFLLKEKPAPIEKVKIRKRSNRAVDHTAKGVPSSMRQAFPAFSNPMDQKNTPSSKDIDSVPATQPQTGASGEAGVAQAGQESDKAPQAVTAKEGAGIRPAPQHSAGWMVLGMWALMGVVIVALVAACTWVGHVLRPIRSLDYLRKSSNQAARYSRTNMLSSAQGPILSQKFSMREFGQADLLEVYFDPEGFESLFLPNRSDEKYPSLIKSYVPLPKPSTARQFIYKYAGRILGRTYPRLEASYFSLRIEIDSVDLPRGIKIKNLDDFLLIMTSETRGVASNDHQDFRVRKPQFSYRILIDSSEIEGGYNGKLTITLPFQVIEEPIEGYVMPRKFLLRFIV